MKFFLYLYIPLFSVALSAQEEQEKVTDTINKEYFLVKGDTLYTDVIGLDDVVMLKKIKFSSRKDRIKYLILRRKVRKVYPFAKMAADRLTELQDSLTHIKSKRKKKKYTKHIQKYIEEEFSEKLKKFSRTEGQILIKLIHRQTGTTAFELIKELRSGWRAFWYNSTASMFSISLKEEYNPMNNHEDYYIEDVLMRSFMDGILEKQPHALEFDYFELSDKWIKK
ncbi:MAG: DUF4294 domain-containing protein [Flavobacteriaceae bacterium]|nr:DUF4294 domain-containing protein [Flavobacteriaceae bacterium]